MPQAAENECRQMLFTAVRSGSPASVRYPRGAGVGAAIEQAFTELPLGRGQVRREGRRLAILAFGSMVGPAVQAGEALDATVVNMRFVKPIDTALLGELAATHDAFVTVEEHVVMGGAGSACAEALAATGAARPILHLGLPDRFIDHGDHGQLLKREGLDAAGLESSIRARFADLLAGEGARTRLVASR